MIHSRESREYEANYLTMNDSFERVTRIISDQLIRRTKWNVRNFPFFTKVNGKDVINTDEIWSFMSVIFV